MPNPAGLQVPTGHPKVFTPADFPGAVQHSRHSQHVTRVTKPVAKASASDKGRSQKLARGRKKPSQKQLNANNKQRAEAMAINKYLASDAYKTQVACDVERAVHKRMMHLKVDVVF